MQGRLTFRNPYTGAVSNREKAIPPLPPKGGSSAMTGPRKLPPGAGAGDLSSSGNYKTVVPKSSYTLPSYGSWFARPSFEPNRRGGASVSKTPSGAGANSSLYSAGSSRIKVPTCTSRVGAGSSSSKISTSTSAARAGAGHSSTVVFPKPTTPMRSLGAALASSTSALHSSSSSSNRTVVRKTAHIPSLASKSRTVTYSQTSVPKTSYVGSSSSIPGKTSYIAPKPAFVPRPTYVPKTTYVPKASTIVKATKTTVTPKIPHAVAANVRVSQVATRAPTVIRQKIPHVPTVPQIVNAKSSMPLKVSTSSARSGASAAASATSKGKGRTIDIKPSYRRGSINNDASVESISRISIPSSSYVRGPGPRPKPGSSSAAGPSKSSGTSRWAFPLGYSLRKSLGGSNGKVWVPPSFSCTYHLR
ncbi:hypothetical protein BGX28_006781 [Mortierella sp. GBA30]|nr:hypothetical protein BGX28_006781 [Mortierella sp. GBA30]